MWVARASFAIGVVAMVMGPMVASACGSTSPTSPASFLSRAPTRAVIPITIAHTRNGNFPLIHVAVGAGRSVPVILDTGSVGLVLMRRPWGRKSRSCRNRRPARGLGAGVVYPITAEAASARVTFEGAPSATTPKPIAFGAITQSSAALVTCRLPTRWASWVWANSRRPSSQTRRRSRPRATRLTVVEGLHHRLARKRGPAARAGRPYQNGVQCLNAASPRTDARSPVGRADGSGEVSEWCQDLPRSRQPMLAGRDSTRLRSDRPRLGFASRLHRSGHDRRSPTYRHDAPRRDERVLSGEMAGRPGANRHNEQVYRWPLVGPFMLIKTPALTGPSVRLIPMRCRRGSRSARWYRSRSLRLGCAW
jgi:hypothetical protein